MWLDRLVFCDCGLAWLNHILATVNSGTMTIEVHISFRIKVFIFSAYTPRSRIAGSYGSSIFSF